MIGIVTIHTSIDSRESAERIAAALVEERLAACVQIGAVASVYRWQGAVERAEEWRVEAKTLAVLAGAVQARIEALHSYELPELVVTAVLGGSADYFNWVRESVDPPRDGEVAGEA